MFLYLGRRWVLQCVCVFVHVCVCVCVFMPLTVLRVSISVWLYIINIRISMPEAGCHEGTCSGFLVHLCAAPPCVSGWISAETGHKTFLPTLAV